MKDRLPKYPGRVKLTPVAGQADTFDMIRADEPEDVGTPLNKNTFLTDETAEAIGLDPASDPTPNDALANLAARMLAAGNGNIMFGTYTGTGTYGTSGACSLTFDFVPQIVLINGGSSDFRILWNYPGVETDTKNSGTYASNSDGLYYLTVSRNGTTISWYSHVDAGKQGNSSGGTYFYIAIG